MAKIIKNTTANPQTFGGMQIQAGANYTIHESELKDFQSSEPLINALINDPATASIFSDQDSTEMTGIDAINFLLDIQNKTQTNYPFASKVVPEGKLYREKFGEVITLNPGVDNAGTITPGITEMIIVNPFDLCKVNQAEFKWFPEGVCADFFILDSDTGIYQQTKFGVPPGSITPDMLLTQHAHNVGIGKDNDTDHSEYDATLLGGMQIKIVFKNKSLITKDVCVNVVFHNVVAP